MDDAAVIPAMGFGTYGRIGDAGTTAMLYALELGYRHLDTAQSYGTEATCGDAIRRSGLARPEIFVTTKIDMTNCWGGKLIASLRASNDRIGVDAVDLTLIHWPVSPSGRMPMEIYLAELVEAQDLGLTRRIGVSNFTIADLDAAEAILGRGRIATNQFERHLYLQNSELVADCKKRGITVTCYLPLARGACAGNPIVERIARRHSATAHQVALAFRSMKATSSFRRLETPATFVKTSMRQDWCLLPMRSRSFDPSTGMTGRSALPGAHIMTRVAEIGRASRGLCASPGCA